MSDHTKELMGFNISIDGFNEFTPLIGGQNYVFFLKIDNLTSNERLLHLNESSYVTNKREHLMQDFWDLGYMKIDDSIKPNSFKKAGIIFCKHKLDSVSDNDILCISFNLPHEGVEVSINFLRKSKGWEINEINKKDLEIEKPKLTPQQLEKKLHNCIERFEAFEERLNVSLENISINVYNEYSNYIEIFCEVHSTNGLTINESMQIEFILYNHESKIIKGAVSSIQSSQFYGFEIVNQQISLDNIDDIAKIRIYPHK